MAKQVQMTLKMKMDLGKAHELLEAYSSAGMEKAMDWAEGYVKDSFQPGSGKVYIRGGKEHHASAPGEVPAVDSGHLRRNIRHKVEVEKGQVTGYVGTKVKYAKDLELGTPKIAPRPFLRPAVFDHKKEIIDAFELGAKKARV